MFVPNPQPLPEWLHFRRNCSTSGRPFTAFGAPSDDYSRACWLPVLGPTSWVLWGTVVATLAGGATATFDVDELTGALGLGRPRRLLKALSRLERFEIATHAASSGANEWEMSATTPPLPLKYHSTVSATARRFHHREIADFDDVEQQLLHELYPSIYIDHFGPHRVERSTP